MCIRSHTNVYPGIKKEEIWGTWVDFGNWPAWQNDLEFCTFDSNVEVGNFFTLKLKGGPVFKITLTEIVPGKKFTDCTRFFGAKMYDTHELEEIPEGLRLTNTLWVTGPLKWLWIKLIVKNIADSIPAQTQALVDYVRAQHA